MTTIVLADDHHVIRKGLRSLIEEEQDLKIVGEAGNGDETMQLVKSLRPDILILDMVMPGLNGIEITRLVRQSVPTTAIVILSMYSTEGYVHKAIRAGARAYVLKQSTSDELIHAIHEVSAGRRYLSHILSERAIDTYVQETMDSDLDPLLILTSREREVLKMIAMGNTNKEIAIKLIVSQRTVEFHRANIMRKAGLRNQSELIQYCIRTGILSVDI